MGELLEGLLEGLGDFASQTSEVISAFGEAGDKLKDLGPIAEFVRASFEKTGAQFQQMRADWAAIQNDTLQIGAAIASQIAPTVDEILMTIHDDIKDFGPALSNAIKEGKVEELLGDAFEAAVERAGDMLFNPHFWTGLAGAIGAALDMVLVGVMKIVVNIGIALKTVLDKAFQDIYQEMGKIPGMGRALGLGDYKAESFSQIYQENLKGNAAGNETLDVMMGAMKDSMALSVKEFIGAIDESKTGEAQTKLNELVHSLVPNSHEDIVHPPTTAHPDLRRHLSHTHQENHPEESDKTTHFHPEFTSLEKMGFIMSGGKVQNPYHQRSLDLLQQIAENTKHPANNFSVPMPDNKQLYDIIDPSPLISNMV